MKNSTGNPWLASRAHKSGARVRLFCFPYAGGGANIYCRWQAEFPADVDVCSVELPGRLGRLRETPFREVGLLVESLSNALASLFDVPFAFFGYSMGGLIAYELARELMRSRELQPEHLIVAASGAPHTRAGLVHGTATLSDSEFIAHLTKLYGGGVRAQALTDPEIGPIIVRMLRADLGMLDAYRYEDGIMVRAPMTVLGGDGDPTIPREAIVAWNRHTTGPVTVRYFSGDHFFIHTNERAVIDVVRAAVKSRGVAATHLAPVQAL